MPRRARVYIDGYNLYYGIVEAYGHKPGTKGAKLKWLDVRKMSELLLKPGESLDRVKYVTARIKSPEDRRLRQAAFLDVTKELRDVEVFEGRYQNNLKWCAGCQSMQPRFEEKKSDSYLTAQIVSDAHLGLADIIYVVTGDSDVVPAIETVRAHCPHIPVLVAFPPKRHCRELDQLATARLDISESILTRSQLPDVVQLRSGFKITRPNEWTGPISTITNASTTTTGRSSMNA